MKFTFQKTWFVNFGFLKHFSQIIGLGVSIADFGSVDLGSNPNWAQDFSDFVFYFLHL